MGAYFNPGNIAFSDIAHAKIYVDKTGLIAELNNKINEPDRCVVVSHPRRFGKTQAAVMLDAYYRCASGSTCFKAPPGYAIKWKIQNDMYHIYSKIKYIIEIERCII